MCHTTLRSFVLDGKPTNKRIEVKPRAGQSFTAKFESISGENATMVRTDNGEKVSVALNTPAIRLKT